MYLDVHAGIGGVTALRLIQKHGRLENVLTELEAKGKYDIPQPFPYEEARRLFKGERFNHTSTWLVLDWYPVLPLLCKDSNVRCARVSCAAAALTGDFLDCLSRMHSEDVPCCAEPEVLRGDALPPLKWTPADEEGLVQFLVNEKSFNEDRVRKAVQRVNASKSKSTQGVLHSRIFRTIGISRPGLAATLLYCLSEKELLGGKVNAYTSTGRGSLLCCPAAGRLESFFGPVTVKSSDMNKRKEPASKSKQPALKKKAGGKAGGVGKK